MASAKVLSTAGVLIPLIFLKLAKKNGQWLSLCIYKIVQKRFLISDSVSLSRSHSPIVSTTNSVYFFNTLAKVPRFLVPADSASVQFKYLLPFLVFLVSKMFPYSMIYLQVTKRLFKVLFSLSRAAPLQRGIHLYN